MRLLRHSVCPMTKPFRLIVAVALAAAWLILGPTTARACACGAYITMEEVAVSGETAVIRYQGGVETIDMRMFVGGSSADAAWIMPVPPETDVSLGDNDQFGTLFKHTAPKERVVYDFNPFMKLGGDGSGPQSVPTEGSAPVRVEGVSVIGPFEVTTLSASDPDALNGWLIDHGYTERPDLVPSFASYLEQGWQVLAVKLVSPTGEELGGELDALRMSFPTDEVVYPIRLSAHAQVEQDVRLYVISDHKMDIATEAAPGNPLELRFAGPIGVTDIEPSLSSEDDVYVTLYTGEIAPEEITGDYIFAQAADDDPHQEYYDRVVWMGHITWLGIAIVLGTGLVALIVARNGKRRKAASFR